MAVNTVANDAYLYCDAGAAYLTNDVTMMMWVKVTANGSVTYPMGFMVGDSAANLASTYLQCYLLDGGAGAPVAACLDCDSNNGGSFSEDNTTCLLVIGTPNQSVGWVHLTLWRSGTSVKLLSIREDGTNANSRSFTLTGHATGGRYIFIAAAPDVRNIADGYYSHAKLWSRALSDAEIANEREAARPCSFTNLEGWWPLLVPGDISDHSGKGRNFSMPSTAMTYVDGPAVGWGASPIVYPGAGAAPVDDFPNPHTGCAPWSLIWRPSRI